MIRNIKISEARARLFELIEFVTGHAGAVVVIEHRDKPEKAAIVSERYLRFLRESLSELRRRSGGDDFRAAGSVELLVSDEELEESIAESRIRQAEHAARKFRGSE